MMDTVKTGIFFVCKKFFLIRDIRAKLFNKNTDFFTRKIYIKEWRMVAREPKAFSTNLKRGGCKLKMVDKNQMCFKRKKRPLFRLGAQSYSFLHSSSWLRSVKMYWYYLTGQIHVFNMFFFLQLDFLILFIIFYWRGGGGL